MEPMKTSVLDYCSRFFIVALLLGAGCGKSGLEKKLVGSWGCTVNGATVDLAFRSDHTLTQRITGSVTITQSGSWELRGRQLVFRLVSSSLAETNTIARVNDTHLVLQGCEGNGGTERYERTFTRGK